MENQKDYEELEALPIENPKTEISNILREGDPDDQLAILERKAELAPRMAKAIATILVTQTFPEDWKEFDGTVCLSSAGAERVARLFDIEFYETVSRKEEFTDLSGKGYRYVFEGKARMHNRVVFAQGIYGTRDNFLGKAKGEWRPIEDINENHIRNAAYHIFIGNGVKALLGLRGMPVSRFNEIMGKTGEDPKKAGKVTHAKGTQGGTTQHEKLMQKELAEICIAIANSGMAIVKNGKDFTTEWYPEQIEALELAKKNCQTISSFSGKDGKIVNGLNASELKGKRLEIALANAKKVSETCK